MGDECDKRTGLLSFIMRRIFIIYDEKPFLLNYEENEKFVEIYKKIILVNIGFDDGGRGDG